MKLAISFSGGRTSALMMQMLLSRKHEFSDIRITFANTGCEHPATLDFVNECDKRIAGGMVVWLEAVVDPTHGVGVRHKVVNYETASRNGDPFRAFIEKYGIPNSTNMNCTSRLKTEVMRDYLKSQGFVRGRRMNYATAIGIRADEMDRVSAVHKEEKYYYPLIDANITKADVIEHWRHMPFDLQLPGEHLGNCVWCWKKSLRKHLTIAKDHPESFDFPREMERLYGEYKGDSAAGKDGRRYFFRNYMTVDDIFARAKQGFIPYQDKAHQIPLFDLDLDVGFGCSESCEVGADREAA